MLSKKEMQEIREHLEKAQNPIFYYDNDADGLCSFLIFRRFLGRGKGVAVKGIGLNASYAKKAQELNGDYVFVLDRPELGRDFVEEISGLNLPIVWIDHHNVNANNYEGIFRYNSFNNDEGGEPVTYLAYRITDRKEDMWIAVIGCVADHYMPDFADEFGRKYGEFWGKVKEPFDVYYKTEIGRIAWTLGAGLKDSITNVVKMQNFLINVRTPGEVLLEVPENFSLRKKYQEIKKKYESLLERAKEKKEGKLLFFEYSGELSISAELANELSYIFPEYVICVAFKKGASVNISMRGKGVKGILDRALKVIGGIGGGHEEAVGARIKTENLKAFKDELNKEVNG